MKPKSLLQSPLQPSVIEEDTLVSRRVLLLGMGAMALSGCGLADDNKTGEQAADAPSNSQGNATAVGSRRIPKIGIQLYSIRFPYAARPVDTLKLIRDVGYDQVQYYSGAFGSDLKATRKVLDDLGLVVPSTHIGWDLFERFDPGFVIDAAATLGSEYVNLPWVPEEGRDTVEFWQQLAERFNRAGEALSSANIKFAYHNHDFEFNPVGGTTGYEILASESDPGLVHLELDMFWARKAGVDMLQLFKTQGDRIKMCHIKDMSETGAMVTVGDGIMDFAELLAAEGAEAMEYFFFEHDDLFLAQKPENPAIYERDLQTAYTHLDALRY